MKAQSLDFKTGGHWALESYAFRETCLWDRNNLYCHEQFNFSLDSNFDFE